MLFRTLFNYFKKTDNNNSNNISGETSDELCSLLLSIDENQEYRFEIKWGQDPSKVPNTLCNLILGVTYGFFTDDILAILNDYKGGVADNLIIGETLDLIETRKLVLQNILKKGKDIPVIKPSQVFQANE